MSDWHHAERILTLPSVPLGMSHALPHCPGVYCAIVSDMYGHAFVGYVGISRTSLYQRWGGHRSANGKLDKLSALAHAVSLPVGPAYVVIHYDVRLPADDLGAIESEVIKTWNPPLNAPQYGKGGTPLLITPNTTMIGGTRDRRPVYVSPETPSFWSINCYVAEE